MDEKLAYSIDELLELLPISRARLYQLWQEGKGPKMTKVGKRVLIRRDAAEQWLADLEEETTRAQEG